MVFALIGYALNALLSYANTIMDYAYESNYVMALVSCFMALVFIVHVKTAAILLGCITQPALKNPVVEFPSPIDISRRGVCRVDRVRPLQWNCYEEMPPAVLLENNGNCVIMRVSCAPNCTPYISGGTLPGNYYFVEAIFKWGTSEHLIDSCSYAMELQMLHATNLQNSPDEYLTISYLFALADRKNKYLEQVVENLAAIRPAGSIIELPPFELATLIHRFSNNYYTYRGTYANGTILLPSQWLISTHICFIGIDQLAQFSALCDPEGHCIARNARNVKPLGNRRVALNC